MENVVATLAFGCSQKIIVVFQMFKKVSNEDDIKENSMVSGDIAEFEL